MLGFIGIVVVAAGTAWLYFSSHPKAVAIRAWLKDKFQ